MTANLSIKRENEPRLVTDTAALEQAVTLAMELHERIPGSPVPRAEALLALPGVMRPAQADEAADTSGAAAGFTQALAALAAARQSEGARLAATLRRLLDEIAALHGQAALEAADQPAAQRARVMENLAAAAARGAIAARGTDRAGGRTAGRALRRARGTRSAGEPYRSGARIAARGSEHRASVRLPGAGVQPRGQHAVQQIGLGGADCDRPEAEGDDRAVARAGAEHRMTVIARRGVCLVLSAPSGAGKTAIADALLASEPELRRSVSVTTRAPRAGEIDGVHYHFRDQTEFDRMVAAGELLEWARVLGQHCYGTPRAPVEQALRAGNDVVFDIDWQGHRQLRDALPGRRGRRIRSATIARPRWSDGCGTVPATMRRRSPRRMALARDEISHWSEFAHVVVNDELDRAIGAVRAVLHAARLATARQMGLQDFIASL